MTSRERVLAALRRETPDRVPLDLGGTESSGIHLAACNRLRRLLGLVDRPPHALEVYQQVAAVDDDLRAALEIDTVPLMPEPVQWEPWKLNDGSECMLPELWKPEPAPDGGWVVRDAVGRPTARMPAGGWYFEPVGAPLANAASARDLDAHKDAIETFDWPAYADEPLERLLDRARRLHTQTDKAVVLNAQCHLLAAGQLLRGFENFMADLIVDKALADAVLERLTDAYIRRLDGLLRHVGSDVDVILFNDDLGTQDGPMLSLDTYREMIWPYQKKLFAFAKSRANVSILFHSCGAVGEFIPSLLEAGIDGLNPVQVSAADMDPARLKRRFGRDLCFWGGGCDTQHVLNHGTHEEIEEEVRRRLEAFGPGGFVFTQVHNIQPDVPPDNVMAMIEAYRKYRQ